MKSFVLGLALLISLQADEIEDIANSLKLYPGTKATIQWERVFSSEERMARFNVDTLPLEVRLRLKNYLIEHAADSEQPIVPGL